jgi:hypothetical protein
LDERGKACNHMLYSTRKVKGKSTYQYNIFSSVKSNFLSLFCLILVLTSILVISGYKLVSGKKNKIQT